MTIKPPGFSKANHLNSRRRWVENHLNTRYKPYRSGSSATTSAACIRSSSYTSNGRVKDHVWTPEELVGLCRTRSKEEQPHDRSIQCERFYEVTARTREKRNPVYHQA